MRRFFFPLVAVLGLAFGSTLSATPSFAEEQTWRLNMTSQYMDKHPIVANVYKPWAEEIKKRTNGRVIITYFNPNTICPEGEILDSTIKGGQVHIGSHMGSRNPGKTLLNSVNSPMITSNAMASSMTYWNLFNETEAMQKELDGIKVLWLHTSAPSHINTVKKPVKTLEDLQGMKMIGATGLSLVMLRSLGANPIQVPNTDIYLSLQRNMAEGVLFPIAPLRSFKINEATKYSTLFYGPGGAIWAGMNKATWDSFPEDIKQIFEETTGEVMVKACAAMLDKTDIEDLEFLTSKGHTVITLPDAEKERWRVALREPYENYWLEQARPRYDKADALLQRYREIAKESEAAYGVK